MEENAESHLAYGILLFPCDFKSSCVKNLFYEGFPYCVIVVDMACSCLIGFVWILDYILLSQVGQKCRRHSCYLGVKLCQYVR